MRQDKDNLVGAQLRAAPAQMSKVERGRLLRKHAGLQLLRVAVIVCADESEARSLRHVRTPDERASDFAVASRQRIMRGEIDACKYAGPAFTCIAASWLVRQGMRRLAGMVFGIYLHCSSARIDGIRFLCELLRDAVLSRPQNSRPTRLLPVSDGDANVQILPARL